MGVTTQQATWTKLKTGHWGVRVVGSAIAGQSIQVVSRDGKVQTVRIDKVIWASNGVLICSIVSTAPPRRRGASFGHWTCPACDEENPNSSPRCWECGCGRPR